MPFLEPSQDLTPRGVLGVPLTEPDRSGSVIGAAFRQRNDVVSVLSSLRNEGPFAPEPGYNPFEDIKGTPYDEMHSYHFSASRSHAETQAIMQRINQENADRRTLANNGWLGTIASLVAGAVDPVWFLGFGARGPMALKSAFLTGARDVGTMTFKGLAAQEAILGVSQETLPLKESLESVASGTLLWALLGGGAAKILGREGLLQAGVNSLAQGRAKLAEHTGTVSPEVRRPVEGQAPAVEVTTPAADVTAAAPEAEVINKSMAPTLDSEAQLHFGKQFDELSATQQEWLQKRTGITPADVTTAAPERVVAPEGKLANEAPAQVAPSEVVPTAPGAAVQSRIRQASDELVGYPPKDAVRLDALRAELSDIPRAELDAALLDMKKAGEANLMPLDNPRDIAKVGEASLKAGRNTYHTVWLDPESRPAPGAATVGATMGSVGAAATDTRNLSPAPYGLEGWPKVRAMVAKLWPNMDALENGAPVTQRTVAELTETPFLTKGNIAGETTTLRGGPAVDREISLIREAKLSGARGEMMRLWVEHAYGAADLSLLEKAQRAMGRAPEGKLSFNDFDAAVYDALHLEDTHEIPQVAAMAQWYRNQIYALNERAQKAIDGFKPVEPRAGESYAPQIWNKEYIKTHFNKFVDIWTDWLAGQQAVKAAIQERLGVYQGALESHEATIEKMTARLERRRASLEEAEIRQEEVQRFNKFAFKRSEQLSQPLDELRQQISGLTDKVQPQLDKLEQLAEDIKAEKENFPEIKAADALIFKMIGAAQKLKQSKAIIDAVDAAGEYVDAVDAVIGGFKGGIKEASEAAKLARRDLGADDLVALEKSRAEVKKEAEPYLKRLNQLRKDLAEERAARLPGARGGAVFETKIRERGNVIADALSGKRAEIDQLEASINKEHVSAAEMRTKIEEAIAQWEGTSTAEAKTALKARAEYEAERAAKAAAKGEPAPTTRLTGADKQVDLAVKRILESNRDLPREELRARAEEIVGNRILSTPEGRLPYDEHMGGPQVGVPTAGDELRGHTAHRAIDLPYDLAKPYLDRSAVRASVSYLHSVLPDTLIAERFTGDPNMAVKFKEISEYYAREIQGAKSEAEQKRLVERRDSDMQIVAGMRDRIRGVMGYDQGSNTARVSQAALKINNIVSSHMMAVSSLPDFAGTVFLHAFEQGFGSAFTAYLRGLIDSEVAEALKAQGPELRAMGIGIETERSSKQHAVDGITEAYRPASEFERALTWASDKAFLVNLLSPLTDIQKKMASNVAMNAILRASKAVAEGMATKRQLEDLAAANIRRDVAERIWQQYSNRGGAEVKGVYLPNTADWADAEARLAFQAAVARDVDKAVVTPGGEKPFWMSKPGWNMLGQYSTFAVSATQRIMIANLQRADAATAAGMMTAVGMGMLAYRINTLVSGQPASDRPQDWVKEGISRSGVLGAIDNANTITSKLSGGSLDIFRLIGADKPLSRTAGRNAAEVLLGPTYGKISNIARATSAAGRMDWTEGDTHALRMVLMGSNLPYLPRLFDGIEHGANAAFGVPMKQQ